MTVGILQCGAPPEALVSEHGGFGAMVQRLLGPGRDTVIFDLTAEALPAGAAACDAYVLTGSPAGVYDDLPWIAGLLDFLREAKGRAKIVGICFGHQAMAEAYGGSVTKSPHGWGIGLHRYDVLHRASWMDDVADIEVPAVHQDQIVLCPPSARVTLASKFTPYAGLDYGDAISFQFHPEFTTSFGIALLEAKRDRFGALTDPAIASFGRADDCARVASWIGRFLDSTQN